MGMGLGTREVKTICLSKVHYLHVGRWVGWLHYLVALFADGWVGWGDPFNLDQLCFPNECQLRGVGQGWRGANMLLAVGVSLNPRIPPESRLVMSWGGSYHSLIHLDDGVIRFRKFPNH